MKVDDWKGEVHPHFLGFVTAVKQGKCSGSSEITSKTLDLLKQLIADGEFSNAQEMMDTIRAHGRFLHKALPSHASVANMARRVLKIVREEYAAGSKIIKNKAEEVDPQESLHKIVTSVDSGEDYSSHVPDLKSGVIEHISEFEMELETSIDNIAQQAQEHIHSNEIILTLGMSHVVESFLRKAAAHRKFAVIVVTCGPMRKGQELAVSLGKSKINTTVIEERAVWAIMSRVNKVIIGTHTVMANGGLRAISSCHVVALAAKHCSVPVIVLAPLYKLTPQYLCSYDQDAFNSYTAPDGVLDFSDHPTLSQIKRYCPVFDYVPPELITLFISNTGGHAPSYVYRLLSELYHPDDYEM
ncbi:Translation initiation factor eIF-2B subunit beta [Frankliniella fusca]|uniref:Translation initiation factor eIF2B subunit beta n=1 Tax=Frankliniella fusca TaxID=407009 RepID=A0AAE1LGM9_9NEOP|nr:Translation initiation factor eIF-2B subunit beta [Frankliniella fusca]